jgi:hypothetical protein
MYKYTRIETVKASDIYAAMSANPWANFATPKIQGIIGEYIVAKYSKVLPEHFAVTFLRIF